MSGYRTIPTKDTFDVDEKLGGIITVKQLGYVTLLFFASVVTFNISNEVFAGSSDAIYLPVAVLFGGLMFIFGNMDRWMGVRLGYYFGGRNSALERHPELLRNVRSVEEDKIVTLDGRVMAVLKITPINFPLLSDEAKEAKILAFETYLRQLVYPIMHLVQSDSVDAEEYFANLLKNAQGARALGVAGMEEYTRAHIGFLRDFLRANRSRSKNHYVVLQVQDPRFRGGAPNLQPNPFDQFMLWWHAMLTEFQPGHFLTGGSLFVKPPQYVLLDLPGKRMVFRDLRPMPPDAPAGAAKIGPVLQFASRVAMLRYAHQTEGRYYYGPVDLQRELAREFMEMPLREREREYSLDERRRHVNLTGGKTRWSYDEVEKHIAVLSDKLEATGLHVHRVRGEELYTGKHMSMVRAGKVRVTPGYVAVDNTYMKVVYATGYPYQVNLGWLANIVDGREDYDLTMYVYPVSIPEVLNTFRGAILKLSTEKKARSDFLDPETEQHLEDVKSFFTQIVSGKEKYFLSSLYITCKAPSRKSLDTVLEKCKSDLAGASIDYRTADYEMAQAVFSTRLTGKDVLAKKREFPSSSLAATFPHISSSMEMDPNGLFFGFDWMSAPVIFDLTRLPNQHIAITGESGSGKSYFAKSLIPHYLIGGYRVFVTDPDGEYVDLARNFGGSVIAVGPHSRSSINPFDLSGRDVNDKIRSLLGMLSIITGGMNKYQEGLVSDILSGLLEPASRRKRQITMSDFARAVSERMRQGHDEQMRHDLQFLLISIRPFTRGGLYGFVDSPTTVRLNARMHVFDLREYQNDKTLRDLFNYIIFDYITHQLLADKTLKALFMDEGWTMVTYPSSEDYVRYIIKDSRKYNVSFVFLTQELEDMLQSPAGRSILNNTSTQFIFHQKESAMNLMKTTMNLTHGEYEKLLSCGIGEGLMISDKYRLLFRVRTNPVEHSMLTTDPNERKRAEEGRARAAAPSVRSRATRSGAGPATLQIAPPTAGALSHLEDDKPSVGQMRAAREADTAREDKALSSATMDPDAAPGERAPAAGAPPHEKAPPAAASLSAPASAPAAGGAPESFASEAERPGRPEGASDAKWPAMPSGGVPIALSHGLISGKEARFIQSAVRRREERQETAAKKKKVDARRTGRTGAARSRAGRTPSRGPRMAPLAKARPPRRAGAAIGPGRAAAGKTVRRGASHPRPKPRPPAPGGFSIVFSAPPAKKG